MENDADEVITYNVSVIDQYNRTNTSITRQIVRDGVVPSIPSITSSAGSSITTQETTTVSCSVTETNPSTFKVSDGSTTICSSSSTSCSGTYSPTASGTKTLTCTSTDLAGNSRSNTFQLEVTGGTATSSSGGSTSGGSSGGASSSVVVAPVSIGESTTVDVSGNDAGVEQVTFTATQSISGAKVTINPKTENEVSTKPQASVYKYFEVQTQNFDDSQISNAKVAFVVNEDWLSQQGKTASDVVLLRQENGDWKEYSARLLSVSDGTMHFESTVPGFSTFAIALKSVPSSQPEGAVTPSPQPGSTPQQESTPTSSSKRKTGLIVGIVLIVIAGAVLYLVMQKKKGR